MKRTIALVTASAILLTGCGRPQTIGGKYYPTYGIINESSSRSEHICYEASWGNIFWSIVLVETIIAPVYFVGFSLFNPIKAKTNGCGIDSQ